MIWLLPWEEHNDVKHVHWVLYCLLAANVLIFLWCWFGDPAQVKAVYQTYALNPKDPHWYQFITSSFLHGGWMHLFGNMVFLYLFGDNIEDVLGPLGFLLLYLAGGVFGDLLFVSSNPELATLGIGASGCIATIAGAYAVLFAHHPCSVRVMLLVFPILRFDLKAIWMLLLWFGADIAQTIASHGHMQGAGVNFVAHGAGFFVGVMVALFAKGHGVMRRYEVMPVGHGLFGYWPSDMEAAFKREQRMRALRERQRAGIKFDRGRTDRQRHWR